MSKQAARHDREDRYIWRLLTERPRELIEPSVDESPVPGWVLIWSLIFVKMFIGVAILVFFNADKALVFVIGTHWFAPAAIVALLAPLGLFWARLWRMRQRRAELQRAEWHVESRTER